MPLGALLGTPDFRAHSNAIGEVLPSMLRAISSMSRGSPEAHALLKQAGPQCTTDLTTNAHACPSTPITLTCPRLATAGTAAESDQYAGPNRNKPQGVGMHHRNNRAYHHLHGNRPLGTWRRLGSHSRRADVGSVRVLLVHRRSRPRASARCWPRSCIPSPRRAHAAR